MEIANIKKFKQFLKLIFPIVFFIFISFFVLRGIVLNNGTLGHHWDWSIPPLNEEIRAIFIQTPYLWVDSGLGYFNPLGASFIPLIMVYTSTGYLGFNGEIISKLLVFITILLSGITMFYLIGKIISEDFEVKNNSYKLFAQFFGAVFYSLSPFLFNEIIGGATTQFITYAFFPLAFYFLIKVCSDKPNFIDVLLFAITMTIISSSLQNLFLITLVFVLYVLFTKKIKTIYKNIVKSIIIFFLLNMYWIILIPQTLQQSISLDNTLLISTITNNIPSIQDAFAGLGYFTDFFKYLINPNFQLIWFISAYSIIIISIFFLYTNKKTKSLFWIFLFLISLFMSTSITLIGNLRIWIYENIPLMVLFRSPQHILVLLAFTISIIIGLGTFFIISKIIETKRKSKIILVEIVLMIGLLIWVSPWLTGNLSTQTQIKDNVFLLDSFNISPGYSNIIKYILNDSSQFRVLPLPMTSSPLYLKTQYQNEDQGGDPTLSAGINAISFESISNTEVSTIEKIVYSGNDSNIIANILAFYNVKYILLRKDVMPIFSPNSNEWNYTKVEDYLNNASNIQLIKKFENISLWENKAFVPRIYVSNKLSITYNISNYFNSLKNNEDNYQVFILQNQTVLDKIPMINSTNESFIPKIIFQEVNPTKYIVSIENATHPFFLILNQAYNPQWNAYIENNMIESGTEQEYNNGKIKEVSSTANFDLTDIKYLFYSPLSDNHFIANGYANGWYINPNMINKNSFTITLYFVPQSLFYIGNIISGLTFIFCILYILIYSTIKKQ